MRSRRLTLVALGAATLMVLAALPAAAGGNGWSRGGWGRGYGGHSGWHGGHRSGWYGGGVVIYGAYPYGLYAGGPRPFWGSVLGGVAGGILGSAVGNGVGRAAAILGGAVIGSMVGGSVGQYMDDVDHLYVARALEYAPSGRVTAWRNPDTLTRYEVAPVRTFQTTDGRYCREYQTRALVGGAWQQLYGTACRQPDGNWALAR